MNNIAKKIFFDSRFYTLIICGLYFFYCISTDGWHLIDSVDLVIHEAGHWIFIFFGQFLHILGGSLTQVLLPLIFSLYFYLRKDVFSGSLVLMWVGYNLVNVSIYIGDSYYMQLPLLGGDSVIHDWNFLLTELNILSWYKIISATTRTIGIFVMVVGFVLALWKFAIEKYNNVQSY